MARALHALLALLVALAGCSALPGAGTPEPPEHSLSVTVSNGHDVRYEVRVAAVPPQVDGIEVTYENGSTHRFDVSSFDALPGTALRNATAVDAGGSADLSRTFTVGPNEGIGTTVDGVPPNATVVYFLLPASGPGTLRGAGVVYCGPGAGNTALTVEIRPDGSTHSSVVCSDTPE